jgi:hypothetical protein
MGWSDGELSGRKEVKVGRGDLKLGRVETELGQGGITWELIGPTRKICGQHQNKIYQL